MIVFSSSLITAAASNSSIDLNAPIFGYRSEVTSATIAATDAATNYPVTNLANVSTAEFWKALNATGTKYLTVTPSVAKDLDYIAVAGHNFGSAQIAVTVQTKLTSGSSWVDEVAEFMPTNDNALILRFTQNNFYSIRLKLAAGSAPAQAAIVYTGLLLVSQRRAYVGVSPITMNRRKQVVNGRSESGNFLGRIETGSTLQATLPLNYLTPGWYRANMDPFIEAAASTPFFFGWRPQDYPNECAFCWLTGDPTPENQMVNGMMQVTLDMQGAAA